MIDWTCAHLPSSFASTYSTRGRFYPINYCLFSASLLSASPSLASLDSFCVELSGAAVVSRRFFCCSCISILRRHSECTIKAGAVYWAFLSSFFYSSSSTFLRLMALASLKYQFSSVSSFSIKSLSLQIWQKL
jgi:hypothetical protein